MKKGAGDPMGKQNKKLFHVDYDNNENEGKKKNRR